MKGLGKYFVFGMLLAIFPATAMVIVSANREPEILSGFIEEIITPTPTPTLESIPTPTTVPSPTKSPPPSLTPTSIPIPQPQLTSEQIHAFIERFAPQYSIDPNVLRHIASCESGFNPLAVNGSYIGLYQFAPTAWINNRVQMGEDPNLDLRFNAEESVQTAAYLISIGKGYVWPNCYP